MIVARFMAWVIGLAASLLVTTSAWAYGGWNPMGFWQAYGLVVGKWFPGLLAFMALYVIFSFWIEKTRHTLLIPALLHVLVSVCVAAPMSAVKGAPGPAHVASSMCMLTFVAFCALLWAKVIVLTWWRWRKKKPVPQGPTGVAAEGRPEGA